MIDVLQNLDKVLGLTVQLNADIRTKIRSDHPSEMLVEEINLFIDAIVEIHKQLQPMLVQDPDAMLSEMFDETANHLVDIIAEFEEHGAAHIRNFYEGPFSTTFSRTVELLNQYIQQRIMRKKVVVYGFNAISIQVGRLLDPKQAFIVAYVSDQPNLQGKSYEQVPILDASQAQKIPHDYAVVTEESMACMPTHEKVIDLADFISRHYDFELYRAMSYVPADERPMDAFVTGLSYAEVAIDVRELPYNIMNLAVSSQDLFYDFEIAKHLLKKAAVRENVKFAILGIAYYSFEYDLSKSSRLKHKTYQYYPFFQSMHHHEDPDGVLDRLRIFESWAKEIFIEDYKMALYHILKTYNEAGWETYISGEMGSEQIGEAEAIVATDCAKNYPETVEENIRILKDYVELLASYDIKPILVICPTSRHYHSLFSNRIKNNFEAILNQFEKEYRITVLDYFDSEHFGDDDFYDVSHMNKKGARKFTHHLQQALSAIL